MDHRIRVNYFPYTPFFHEDELQENIEEAIERDNKQEFLKLINDPGFERYIKYDYSAVLVFENDALECGKAILEGETQGRCDIKDALERFGGNPFHLAAHFGAYQLWTYLLQKAMADGTLDYSLSERNLNKETPLDRALHVTSIPYIRKGSIFHYFYLLCASKTANVEIARFLVKETQDEKQVIKRFYNYAKTGKVLELGALFLVVPEVLVSSFDSGDSGDSPFARVYAAFSSLKERTEIQERLLLLLDVFAIVGDKLAAYIRLEEPPCGLNGFREQIAFLLREVASKKSGISSSDEYFWRFFKRADGIFVPKGYENVSGVEIPIKGFMKDEDAKHLNEAIEKKLSSMPHLHKCFEVIRRRFFSNAVTSVPTSTVHLSSGELASS